MNNPIPRVAAIHDMSGFGRCSLTVALPILSCMGIQACPLPTAILSTHSDGFGRFYFHDFTDHMEGYAAHWESVGVTFDCIYTGFLGSGKQIDIVLNLFKKFIGNQRPLIIVDPVMGDQGRLYETYTTEMQSRMQLLVNKADLITPNLTEACFLLHEAYTEESMKLQRIKDFLVRLSSLGPETVVITGVKTAEGHYANFGYAKRENRAWMVPYEYVPAQYPGTGDIFTSVLCGCILQGDCLSTAMERATRFVYSAVQTTYVHGTPAREGVLFEKALPGLADRSSDGKAIQIV